MDRTWPDYLDSVEEWVRRVCSDLGETEVPEPAPPPTEPLPQELRFRAQLVLDAMSRAASDVQAARARWERNQAYGAT